MGARNTFLVVALLFCCAIILTKIRAAPAGHPTTDKKESKTSPDGSFQHISSGLSWNPEVSSIYEKLLHPTQGLRMKTNNIITAYTTHHQMTPLIPTKGLVTECRQKLILWPGQYYQRQDRIIFAMTIFQQFVGVTQEIQLLDVYSHKNKTSIFVKNFRNLEFLLRGYVEEELRNTAQAIVSKARKQDIPLYDIGKVDMEKLQNQKRDPSMEHVRLNIVTSLGELFLCLNIMEESIQTEAGYNFSF